MRSRRRAAHQPTPRRPDVPLRRRRRLPRRRRPQSRPHGTRGWHLPIIVPSRDHVRAAQQRAAINCQAEGRGRGYCAWPGGRLGDQDATRHLSRLPRQV